MTHGEKAEMLFKSGCNCSQAVLGAYCEECGLDTNTALKLISSFGGGMGRMREVCGAVSGIFAVAGLKYGFATDCSQEEKKAHYQRIQDIAQEFIKRNGSLICRELLGLQKGENSGANPSERTELFYRKRPCSELCHIACDIFDEMFK